MADNTVCSTIYKDINHGIFITLEGIDGSGKSTQAELLERLFLSLSFEVVSIREPGGTALSEKIREMLLDIKNSEMSRECELLLYEAARAQLVQEVIVPALSRGAVVICDRFFDSTYAYQYGGRALDARLVNVANELGSCGVVPDLTLVFDLCVEDAFKRAIAGGADRMEEAGLDFQEKVRAAYLTLATAESKRVFVVDAAGSIEDVFKRSCSVIKEKLPALAEKITAHEAANPYG